MVFEVTRDYTIIVPLMISNLISFFISYGLQREPIYEALARQEGVYLPTAESRALLGRKQVLQAMHTDTKALPSQLTVAEALDLAERSGLKSLPVTDKSGLCAVIGKIDLQSAMAQGWGEKDLADVIGHYFSWNGKDPTKFSYVHSDHSLAVALERMGASGSDMLPVVSRGNLRQLLGIITLDDILASYGVAKPFEAAAETEK
jgi:CIC family chloride channel protein